MIAQANVEKVEAIHSVWQRVNGVFAGSVAFIIYFIFCIVFSTLLFSDAASASFGMADGVGIVLLGTGVGCLTFSQFSSCKGIIAGPDLIPIIFVRVASVV